MSKFPNVGSLWVAAQIDTTEVQITEADDAFTRYRYLRSTSPGLIGQIGKMATEPFMRLFSERDLIAEQTPKVVPGQTWWFERTRPVVVLSVLSDIVTFSVPNSPGAYGAAPVDRFLRMYTPNAPELPQPGETWKALNGSRRDYIIAVVTDEGQDDIVVYRHADGPTTVNAVPVPRFIEHNIKEQTPA